MAEKRYYWMRLKPTFFTSKEIKKLRKIAGGDTFVIIYLKMQLLSLETGGKLYFDGVEENFAEEIALELDEDADNVQMTIAYLEKCGLIEQRAEDEYFLPEVSENTGSETAAAGRMRKSRNRNIVTLECNNVTPMLQDRYTEKEKEKELELERKKECDRDGKPSKPSNRFVKPSVADIKAYCIERQNNIDAERFFDYYEANGWVQSKGKPIKDWKATVRTWERNQYNNQAEQKQDIPDMFRIIKEEDNRFGGKTKYFADGYIRVFDGYDLMIEEIKPKQGD